VTAEEPPEGAGRALWSTVTVGALAVVVLVLATAVGVMGADLTRLQRAETAAEEALAAARALAPDLLSYDHRTIDQDLARARQHTTGELTGHYRDLAQTLVPTAREQRASQEVAVAAAAVESAAAEHVQVLLFIDVTTVKTLAGEEQPQRQVSRNRARFLMVKEGDRWRVAALSTLLGTI
jgi:Mce-associated membrane protein